MKLQQDQIWQAGENYYRIVRLERLAVTYRLLKDLDHRHGKNVDVTKKEFCRLIKGAELVAGPQLNRADAEPPKEVQD
ncbi:MAG: hypothetical protein ABI443_01895 [Chthoniobacterales bacterium]